MSERKRMSRAKVAADPQREVFRGVPARSWFADGARNDPPTSWGAAADEALFRAPTQGSFPDPVRPDGGTFSNGPRNVLTIDALNAAMEALRGPRVTLPQTIAMPERLFAEMQRFGVGRGDDVVGVSEWARGFVTDPRERERARLRAAQYEREAPWRARILASIPAPQHITAAELRARVVLPTLRERLGQRS